VSEGDVMVGRLLDVVNQLLDLLKLFIVKCTEEVERTLRARSQGGVDTEEAKSSRIKQNYFMSSRSNIQLQQPEGQNRDKSILASNQFIPDYLERSTCYTDRNNRCSKVSIDV